jgi:tRNA/rRNA methyltransferase
LAGTDHRRRQAPTESKPVFVLVEPQLGENIGAAARAMWNFGLDRLRIVNPRDGWPNARAVAMASGAAPVLDAAQVAATTADACADLTWLVATTARPRQITKRVLTPERAMAAVRARIAAGERVGVLFGPERSGLATPDVVRAGAIVTVPVNPAFGSLNLAQCVLLMAYEWQRAGEVPPPEQLALAAGRLAEAAEVDRLLAALETRLDAAGFFHPPEKRERMLVNLRNLFRRMDLSDADVRTLHGVVRALSGRDGPK